MLTPNFLFSPQIDLSPSPPALELGVLHFPHPHSLLQCPQASSAPASHQLRFWYFLEPNFLPRPCPGLTLGEHNGCPRHPLEDGWPSSQASLTKTRKLPLEGSSLHPLPSGLNTTLSSCLRNLPQRSSVARWSFQLHLLSQSWGRTGTLCGSFLLPRK